MEALISTYTISGVPYYNHSIVGPKTLFLLLRPLYYVSDQGAGSKVFAGRLLCRG